FGHHLGDEVLKRLTNIFTKHLPGNAHLIRLGGDEFAVLYSGDKFEEIINRCLRHLQTDPALLKAANGMPVLVSTGYASIKKDETPEFEAVYKRADEQLYATKKYNKKIIDTQLLSVIRSTK
ncbi:MAG: diguanylate cyclase, partial [Gammaproteobacteria bacterium]|nr:diguanylate cyclase [Gammaproteobacteria bacterium]